MILIFLLLFAYFIVSVVSDPTNETILSRQGASNPLPIPGDDCDNPQLNPTLCRGVYTTPLVINPTVMTEAALLPLVDDTPEFEGVPGDAPEEPETERDEDDQTVDLNTGEHIFTVGGDFAQSLGFSQPLFIRIPRPGLQAAGAFLDTQKPIVIPAFITGDPQVPIPAPAPPFDRAAALFPVATKNKWTTCPLIPGAYILSPEVLQPRKEASTSSRPIGTYEGRRAIRAFMRKGSLTPGTQPAAGFSFYAKGPIQLTSAKEVLFSYSIFFEKGYQFQLGGKLPGLYGGEGEGVAATCSGGRHDPRCFSARLMWREDGLGELYLYLPENNANKNICGKNMNGPCTSEYGASVGRGRWKWTPGKWQTIAQRLALSDPGKANGEIEIYIDGVSVLKKGGLYMRAHSSSVVRGYQMQIFFGGHTKPWACPKDENVYFADLGGAVVR